MFIANAAAWEESSPSREIERNSMGWRILRAYAQLSTSRLQAMTGRERYAMLMDVVPGLLFRTPRPEWAARTYSQSDESGDVCTHELKLSPRGTVELILERTDTADPSGELHLGEPAVFLYVGEDERRALTPHDLMALAKSANAGAVQLTRALRG
ncbi:hypothetical protein [Arthrobacter sp. FW306-2-2C-D06B]|uniref:hypothetical protein n=1 Tax=Arthrobacter sp. FW306-2-2C-D06B TaxID=2879618 RepID=UPI001F38381F|nr:hypothetical protein [Arthrobacter sp. FW306-2-2C-D06B]UKA57507.1 hypothetical protein LFT47_14555 [Arthrobacter sp. FW306-2-2C-D06B]